LKEAVLVDRWNSEGEFILKVNLFPEKVPKTFHKCSTNVASFINPPAVKNNSDNNYTGLEINSVDLAFKRLNLTAQYIVTPNRKDSFYRVFIQNVGQLENATSDIAVGCLPLHSHFIQIAEATIPYIYDTVLWYVPYPKPASRWKPIHKIFGSPVWACFSAVAILAVIIMWLLAKYETQLYVRESSYYKTIIYCIYNI
jgi:hypothetical protein